MYCYCNNINRRIHRVLSDGSTVSTTAVALAVTNSSNIANYSPFTFIANQGVIDLKPVSGAPVPVTIGVNGTQIPLWNKYGEQILSDDIPKYSKGYAVTEGTTPHVILLETPWT